MFDQESIKGLAETMNGQGLLNPILLRLSVESDVEKFILLEGARRLRAAIMLRWEFIDALVEQAELNKSQMLQRTIIANIQREDFTPVEKARGIKELMECSGWDATKIAKELGLTNAAVSRSLALLTLPETILAQVESGAIAAASAVGLARIDDPAIQHELAVKAAAKQLTRDEIERAAKALKKPKPKAAKTSVRRMTAVLGENRSITIVGESLSMENCAECLRELLALVTKFRASMGISTFAQMLAEQASKPKS